MEEGREATLENLKAEITTIKKDAIDDISAAGAQEAREVDAQVVQKSQGRPPVILNAITHP